MEMDFFRLLVNFLISISFLLVACFCIWVEFTYKYSGGMAFVSVLFGLGAFFIKMHDSQS